MAIRPCNENIKRVIIALMVSTNPMVTKENEKELTNHGKIQRPLRSDGESAHLFSQIFSDSISHL